MGQALRELTASDVRQACDVLRPVYDATGGVDGRVSIEVDPRIAHDTQRTVAEAHSIHGSYAQSQAVLDELTALGVDYGDVVQTLEDQGVATFDASWDHLGQRLATALSARRE